MTDSTRTASLPMYDLPEVRRATDRWWQGLAGHLKRAGVQAVPDTLLHDQPVQQLWDDSRLLFSQCCGFDVVHGYRGQLNVLLTTDWDAVGCGKGTYSSWLVVHEDSAFQSLDELYDQVAVINELESHSGMNALMTQVNPLQRDGRFFRCIRISGAHVNSLHMIRQGGADIAAIDCVTFALLERYRPAAIQGIRIIGQTAAAPAHPYVTRTPDNALQQHEHMQRMQQGLAAAFADPQLLDARQAILLKDGLFQGEAVYRKIAEQFGFLPALLDVAEHRSLRQPISFSDLVNH